MSEWRIANDIKITVLRKESPHKMMFVKDSSGIIEISMLRLDAES